MELHDAIRRRAMVRSFSTRPVDPAVVDRILRAALSAPTAGNTGATAWVVLEGPDQVSRYWEAATDEDWRTRSARWPGLKRAPVVLLAYADRDAYVARYAEVDKMASGLGENAESWPVPYWFGDAAFGVMVALLGAVDAGLGACILGSFRGEVALAQSLAIPPGWLLFCAVVLGHPDGADHRSLSLDRIRPPTEARIHRGGWEGREAVETPE
jgi:nitroreductase